MAEDISILVRRSLDNNPDPGAQNEAASARMFLRKKLIDANHDQPILFGKQAATVDVMALMEIHNKPLVNENARLKKENKQKDKQIEELTSGGHVAVTPVHVVVESRQPVSDSEHAKDAAYSRKQLAAMTAENGKLINQLNVALAKGATLNDLSVAGAAKKAPAVASKSAFLQFAILVAIARLPEQFRLSDIYQMCLSETNAND